MNDATLVWATPDIDTTLARIARVSNPRNQDNPDIAGLLRYMEANGHVSPFEMANICVEVNTTRDIGRQILRHRSMHFQEFSQRYADATVLGEPVWRECRLQDVKNRQNSLTTESAAHHDEWADAQQRVWDAARREYGYALQRGVAKEVARALLPEGLTPTRMYVNATLRSWVHYLRSRLDPSTQKEHRLVAQSVLAILRQVAPVTAAAFFPQPLWRVWPDGTVQLDGDPDYPWMSDDYSTVYADDEEDAVRLALGYPSDGSTPD